MMTPSRVIWSRAPAPRPIHIEVHGSPVTIHAAGADAWEIAAAVELLLRDDAPPRCGRGRAGGERCLRPSSAGLPPARPPPEAGAS